MITDFKEYLIKKDAQKRINDFAKKYDGKNIALYGAGLFCSDLIRNYDLSKLNIVGIADIKFQEDFEGDFYGYKKFTPDDLLEQDIEAVLITVYDDKNIKIELKELLDDKDRPKIEIESLIKMNIIDYIKFVFTNN